MSVGILLSGGMDSAALACWKRPDLAYTVDYGQICAAAEIEAARAISGELKIPHEVITIDCRALGSGDLSGKPSISIAPVPEWWPFRNQLLLTVAAMRAVGNGVRTLMFGSVKSDAVHADGRREFFEMIGAVMAMQEGGLKVETPAINLTSPELIKVSKIELPVLAWAHSCHTSNYACGNCRGCFKHQGVLLELGYGTS